jgi:hypothetical protein
MSEIEEFDIKDWVEDAPTTRSNEKELRQAVHTILSAIASDSYWCYVEICKALTPSPSPAGEGNKKIIWVLLPFSCGRRGWGMRVPRNIR